MSGKPLFVCDLDGVLLDMQSVMAEYLSKTYGKPVYAKDHSKWDLKEAYGLRHTTPMWEFVWATPLPTYFGAKLFIKELQKDYEVRILSSRMNEVSERAGMRDAMTCFPGVFSRFVPDEKHEVLKEWQPAWFLDDRPKNLFDAEALAGLRSGLLLLDRPWNRGLDLDVPWRRVDGYGGVLEAISGR